MTPRAERDYSGRSLFEKLGVASDAQVALVGKHDESFTSALNASLAKGASLALRVRYDSIFVRIDRPTDLARIERAAAHLKPNGALWVFHPKGRGANPTDAQVRAAGISAGLVDNKISAYTESHTVTRFVIPRARR
jgi:GTP cyclohydrolase III